MEINKIYNENNIITIKNIPDNYLSGIITSPPYNICSKRSDMYYNNGYSHIDNCTEDEFLSIRLNEFIQFERIVKNNGVILYNISYHNENPILPLLLLIKMHENTNLTIADIIAWKKPHSIPFQTSPTKLSRIVENIYVIVNKDYLHKFKTNKEISKINDKTGQSFYKNYVNFIEAKNNDGIICKLKASYSTELVEKLIDVYFPINSLIYDPFSGIATTAMACKNKNINFIGSEINKESFEIGNERLENNFNLNFL